MLSPIEIAAARRHLGIPVAGIPNTDYTMGARAYNADDPNFAYVGAFEQRILNLTPYEESTISGRPIASAVFSGIPQTGTIVVTVLQNDASTTLCTYTITPQDLAQYEPLLAIVQNISRAINSATNAYSASIGLHTPGGKSFTPQAQFSVMGLANIAFSLSIATSVVSASVLVQGDLPKPKVAFEDPDIALYGYLQILDFLEGGIALVHDFVQFQKADVVMFNQNEQLSRVNLYNYWRGRLASYLGVKLNPLGNNCGKGSVA